LQLAFCPKQTRPGKIARHQCAPHSPTLQDEDAGDLIDDPPRPFLDGDRPAAWRCAQGRAYGKSAET